MKKKTLKTETRGRKAGDGVLKNIEQKSSLLKRQMMLAYGATHDNRLSQWVRWFRDLRSMLKDSTNQELVNKRTDDIVGRLHQQMVNALFAFKPDWFEKMAEAIKAENIRQDAYPLHAALLSIAGAPQIRSRDLIHPENFIDVPVIDSPRYTFSEVCDLVEKQGLRPKDQDEASWKVTVRRACNQIGFPLLPSKPGPKSKKP